MANNPPIMILKEIPIISILETASLNYFKEIYLKFSIKKISIIIGIGLVALPFSKMVLLFLILFLIFIYIANYLIVLRRYILNYRKDGMIYRMIFLKAYDEGFSTSYDDKNFSKFFPWTDFNIIIENKKPESLTIKDKKKGYFLVYVFKENENSVANFRKIAYSKISHVI